jgi:hypothetical protein
VKVILGQVTEQRFSNLKKILLKKISETTNNRQQTNKLTGEHGNSHMHNYIEKISNT